LQKKSSGKGKLKRSNWKRRWFAIEDSSSGVPYLTYFTNQGSSSKKGSVPLDGYRVRRLTAQEGLDSPGSSSSTPSKKGKDVQEKYLYRFELTHSDSDRRLLRLQAGSTAEVLQWVGALRILTSTGGDMGAGVM
jgi:hypothetical protein